MQVTGFVGCRRFAFDFTCIASFKCWCLWTYVRAVGWRGIDTSLQELKRAIT
jgi:hypothetical protein